jgi:hypothetical protein
MLDEVGPVPVPAPAPGVRLGAAPSPEITGVVVVRISESRRRLFHELSSSPLHLVARLPTASNPAMAGTSTSCAAR